MPVTRANVLARKHRIARAFEDAGLVDVAAVLKRCDEEELLVVCTNCSKAWYVPDHCRSRVCPICSYKVTQERASFLELVCRRMAHPKFLTLTMPLWRDDPGEGIDYLRHAFTRLRHSVVMKKCTGGAYQIELKRKPEGWHIHLHALLNAPYLPRQKLFTAWGRILGIAAPQINIKSAPTARERAYTCKYAAKSADFEGEIADVVAWYRATKGKRLWGTWGAWYNAKLEDLLDADEHAAPIAVCPHCKAEHSIVFARDGPYVLGNDVWQAMYVPFLRHLPFSRPAFAPDQD